MMRNRNGDIESERGIEREGERERDKPAGIERV